MRFDFTIYADDMVELGDAFDAIRSALPANLFDAGRGYSINVTPCGPRAGAEGAKTATDTPAPSPSATPARRPRAGKPAADASQPAADTVADTPADTPAATAQDVLNGLSDVDAKNKALDILRDAYGREGGPAAVKALQKVYGVNKFMEVPEASGHKLLGEAEALIAGLPEASPV